jgi:hypothetical protein
MALLDAPGPGGTLPVSVLATAAGGIHPGGLLQVLALGEVRSEVTVDGTLNAPERYESSARLALRRALEACSSREPVADLDEMLEDLVLAAALMDT